jgi:hypothetical protein
MGLTHDNAGAIRRNKLVTDTSPPDFPSKSGGERIIDVCKGYERREEDPHPSFIEESLSYLREQFQYGNEPETTPDGRENGRYRHEHEKLHAGQACYRAHGPASDKRAQLGE